MVHAGGLNGTQLKGVDEDLKEPLKALQARFPTVSAEKVLQALRNHDGHAGSAAKELRDLTSTNVKPPDPDDAEHVATLLSSPVMFKHACKEQFKKFDVNGDGVLDMGEVVQLTNELYHSFGLQQPSEGVLQAFFNATDENGDGVLSEREFRRFFEMFLRYSFFDVVKMQQLVDRVGKGHQATGNTIAENLGPLQMQGQDDDDAEPAPVRAAPPVAPSPAPQLAPSPQPAVERERSGGGGQASPENRHRSRRSTNDGQSYGGRDGGRGGGSAQYVCVVQGGVSYRRSPEWSDRADVKVAQGEAVQVLEHWIKTPNGWLPVEDVSAGVPLFERVRQHRSERPRNGDDGQRPQESRNRDGNREPGERRREARPPAVEANTAPPAAASHTAAHRKPDEGPAVPDEYKQVYERLKERFPSASAQEVAAALRNNDWAGGKAASELRRSHPQE